MKAFLLWLARCSLAGIAISGLGAFGQASPVVRAGASNTWTTGAQDMGAATSFKIPVSAGATTATNGFFAYDSTNNMLHAAQGGADAKVPQFTITPVNGDCVNWVVTGSNYKLGTAGAACGSGSGTAVSNYETSFTAQTSVTVTGATHAFGHAKIIVSCYDSSSPKALLYPGSVTINTSTYDVVISFSSATTGSCVLSGNGGGGGVSSITGTANEISASASTGAVTLSLPPSVSLASKRLVLPSSITLPATCSVGEIYMDTDATSGRRLYACESANTWALQGDGAGSGDVLGGSNLTTVGALPYVSSSGTLNQDAASVFFPATGNRTFGGTADGAFKLDVAKSGTTGTMRVYDQTATTGTTSAVVRAGAGQASNLLDFQDSTGAVMASVLKGGGATFEIGATGTGKYFSLTNGGSSFLYVVDTGTGLSLRSNYGLKWTSGAADATPDTALLRNAAGVVEVNNGTAGAYRDLTARNVLLRDGTDTTKIATFSMASLTTGTTRTYTWPNASGTVSLSDVAETLTNKTLNVESTGNTVTTVEKRYITAAGCNNATATAALDLPTSGAPTAVCIGTTTTTGLLEYADAATSSATWHHVLPSDWTGTVDITLFYTGSTSSANNIRWQVSTACVGDAEDLIAPTYNTASASNSAGPTTAGQRKSAAFTTVAVTNCAGGESQFWKIERVGADAGDTYTGAGRLLGAELTYRRAQ